MVAKRNKGPLLSNDLPAPIVGLILSSRLVLFVLNSIQMRKLIYCLFILFVIILEPRGLAFNSMLNSDSDSDSDSSSEMDQKTIDDDAAVNSDQQSDDYVANDDWSSDNFASDNFDSDSNNENDTNE